MIQNFISKKYIIRKVNFICNLDRLLFRDVTSFFQRITQSNNDVKRASFSELVNRKFVHQWKKLKKIQTL